MKSLFILFIFILCPALALAQSSTTTLGTTTRMGGGGTWTNYSSSDGSSAQVMATPGGTVIIHQYDAQAAQREYDQSHNDTMRAINRLGQSQDQDHD